MLDESTELGALMQMHGRQVYATLLAITRRPELAEELAQEVFLVAVRKRLRPGPELGKWFRTAARHLAINELRRQRPTLLDPATLATLPSAADAAPGSAREPAFEEELSALRLCLQALPEDERGLLRDRYEAERPLAGLASERGQSEGYMKQRLFRLRRRLAECIQRRITAREVSRG